MRLQALYFLVFLAVIYENHCEEATTLAAAEEVADDKKDAVVAVPAKSDVKKEDDGKQSQDKVEENTDSSEKKPSKSNKGKNAKSSGKKKRPAKSPDYIGRMYIYFPNKAATGKKQKPVKVPFPVARYDRRRFPKFGPLYTFLPWLPIYVEPRSKQTIIYSPVGGVYILPPVVNFYGDIYSVAELIANGYASLVSTGAPPPPSVDVSPFVQTGSLGGTNIPTVNPNTGGFTGAVTSDFTGYPATSFSYPYGANYGYPQQQRNAGY
ncbi:unnamed protein product [Rotaria magnacalcarata]|uniref:Uncharacterized protein n=1 Tax=Rotaria magnacalcarata TaxID=392030 RepID=A0A820QG72_9BILA|nr:unnamed protein product [Rotaria magnacalcarata]CAF1578157.1 unnamed protein product [Rotaria magnacalcarata]CAF2081233.1 unnamed protein product [Rotaria magnacalcarata]CAF2088259.1 unnamed protein product [Rotaria magnacalcarata]CAF2112244.1 unnamed protein product [Rotaria magnacalcarata]